MGAGAGFAAALVAVYVMAHRKEPLLAQSGLPIRRAARAASVRTRWAKGGPGEFLGYSSPETRDRGEAANRPLRERQGDACADLHRVRRKSSVNGNSGLSSFGGATIMPAVWPVS